MRFARAHLSPVKVPPEWFPPSSGRNSALQSSVPCWGCSLSHHPCCWQRYQTVPAPVVTPGMSLTTAHCSLGHQALDHNSLSVTNQPISYPPTIASIKSTSLQFTDKHVSWDSVKFFAQVQVGDIAALPLSPTAITLSYKPTKSVRHGLPLVKPYWLSLIISLFSICLSIVSRRMYSVDLQATEVFLFSLFKNWVMFSLFQIRI